MKSLFQGSDIFVHAPSLEPDEVITNTWVAAVPLWGIFSKHGGNLVLTNKRLLFEPLKIPDFAPGAKYLKFFAVEENGSNLSQISRAEAVPGGGARVRLISKHSNAAEFLIFASRVSSVWSGTNKSVRDKAVQQINRAIGQASGC